MKDGVYQVTRGAICAGFVVKGGRVVACAPVLRKRIAWWATQANYVGPVSS